MSDLNNHKLYSLEHACAVRETLRLTNTKVVLTNGCFDLLHTGHLYFLQMAKAQGDALFVAVNSSNSVKKLKGPKRPVQDDEARAYALAALACVNGLFFFDTERLCKEIEAFKPDVYVKAGDYTLETIDQSERKSLESVGAYIRFLPFLEGFSTTDLIKRIHEAY